MKNFSRSRKKVNKELKELGIPRSRPPPLYEGFSPIPSPDPVQERIDNLRTKIINRSVRIEEPKAKVEVKHAQDDHRTARFLCYAFAFLLGFLSCLVLVKGAP